MRTRIEKAWNDYRKRFIENGKTPAEGAFYGSDYSEVISLAKQRCHGRDGDFLYQAVHISLSAGFMIGYRKAKAEKAVKTA